MTRGELAVANLLMCADRVNRAAAKEGATLEDLLPLTVHLAEAVLGATQTLPQVVPFVRALEGVRQGDA